MGSMKYNVSYFTPKGLLKHKGLLFTNGIKVWHKDAHNDVTYCQYDEFIDYCLSQNIERKLIYRS